MSKSESTIAAPNADDRSPTTVTVEAPPPLASAPPAGGPPPTAAALRRIAPAQPAFHLHTAATCCRGCTTETSPRLPTHAEVTIGPALLGRVVFHHWPGGGSVGETVARRVLATCTATAVAARA